MAYGDNRTVDSISPNIKSHGTPSSTGRTYNQSTKIRDTGANVQPGHDAAPRPFADVGSKMLTPEWKRGSR